MQTIALAQGPMHCQCDSVTRNFTCFLGQTRRKGDFTVQKFGLHHGVRGLHRLRMVPM